MDSTRSAPVRTGGGAPPKKPVPGTNPMGGTPNAPTGGAKAADLVSVRQTKNISDRGGKRTADPRKRIGEDRTVRFSGDVSPLIPAASAAQPISTMRALSGIAIGTILGCTIALIAGLFGQSEAPETILRLIGGSLLGAVCGGIIAHIDGSVFGIAEKRPDA